MSPEALPIFVKNKLHATTILTITAYRGKLIIGMGYDDYLIRVKEASALSPCSLMQQ